MDQDYKILGVKETDDVDIIRIAYIKLAKLYHPDKNKSIEAEKLFKQICKSYHNLIKIKEFNRKYKQLQFVETDANVCKPS